MHELSIALCTYNTAFIVNDNNSRGEILGLKLPAVFSLMFELLDAAWISEKQGVTSLLMPYFMGCLNWYAAVIRADKNKGFLFQRRCCLFHCTPAWQKDNTDGDLGHASLLLLELLCGLLLDTQFWVPIKLPHIEQYSHVPLKFPNSTESALCCKKTVRALPVSMIYLCNSLHWPSSGLTVFVHIKIEVLLSRWVRLVILCAWSKESYK